MTMTSSVVFGALMILAIISDLRTQRIPKALTIPGLFLGLAVGVLGGWAGFSAAVLGVVVAFVLGTLLFSLGAIGGGDVKLLMVVGAFMGPSDLFYSLLAAGAIGGILALFTILRNGVVLPALIRARELGAYFLTLGRKGDRRTLQDSSAIKVPYGVAIALGALIVRFYTLYGGIS
jgi:prepilin peptidase CpaA